MSPRLDVSEERKNQILAAAATVFARTGFDKARMDDIAHQAGLSKGAIYWYFKSKDEIIAAILDRMFARQLQGLQGLLSAEGSVEKRLLLFSSEIVAEMQRMSALLPIAFEFYAVAARQESVREFLKDYFRGFREIAAALIQQGIESGEFRPVNPEETAVVIAALYEGLALLWIVDPAAVNWCTVGESPVRLLLDGIKRRD